MLIAQISDIHAKNKAPSMEAIRRATSYLSRLRPHALIVSGDLVEEPTEENYRLVKGLLANPSFPVFMIPGNADNQPTMRAVFPEHHYWPQMGPMNFAIDLNGKVRLIGFDVTVEGEIFGNVTPEALRWLGAECAREPLLPTLVMMHQHPFKTGIGPLDDLMCRNAEGLADLVGGTQGRVRAIVCGHGHRTIFTTIRNVPAIMCPSLCPANPLLLDGYDKPEVTDAPGLLVHHFHENRMNSHAISLA